jgi:hypothetical protein
MKIYAGGNGPDRFDCGACKDKITDFKASEGDKKTKIVKSSKSFLITAKPILFIGL